LSLVITKACITTLSVTQTRHELSFYAVHIRERRRIASSFPFELAGLEVAEVIQKIADWTNAEVLTMGQYLQPTWNHLPINRWVHPDFFASFKSTDIGDHASSHGGTFFARSPIPEYQFCEKHQQRWS
jgi:hypothetical protein